LTFVFYAFWGIGLPILAMVFGAIGIAKDDSKALGVVGLVLGIISLILVGIILSGLNGNGGGGFF